MRTLGPKWPSMLKTWLFVAIAIGLPVVAVFVGRCLYNVAAKPATDFYAKLGELTLQLAVISIVGALFKVVFDSVATQRARQRARDLKKRENQKEFLRRVRAMHVTIQNAKDLMEAHQSAKTWGEQSRRLMVLHPKVEEISLDLEVSDRLFLKQPEICKALKAIVCYLGGAKEEYKRCYEAVDRAHKAHKSLVKTMEEQNMTWVCDFMKGGEHYKNYGDNLTNSKGAMRAEVYGPEEPAQKAKPRRCSAIQSGLIS